MYLLYIKGTNALCLILVEYQKHLDKVPLVGGTHLKYSEMKCADNSSKFVRHAIPLKKSLPNFSTTAERGYAH